MGEIFSNKNVMHIDTSVKFYQKGDTGIAFKILNSGAHKGLVLTNQMKRDLDRQLNADREYAMLYAICIEALIKNDLKNFDILVICGDENPLYVKLYLDYLFSNNPEYHRKNIMSIGNLRMITGNPKLKSQADGIAMVYRKKASKPLYRQQRGISLNMINLNYLTIVKKWSELHNIQK